MNHKILIIYYSLTGNVKFMAEKLGDILQCDIKDINEISSKAFSKISLIKDYLIPFDCELTINQDELLQYDMVILGYPIWMFNKVHPLFNILKSRLESLNHKYAQFTSYGFCSWNFPGKSKYNDNFTGSLKMKSPFHSDEQAAIKALTEWAQELTTKLQ
ncbi:MAG: flavodoxin family protein [Candidatus Marinimicrobia bacterium]|nr:flavodoxin family protein [Candidatus Neomarinimicrobiota bacterium]